MSIKQKSIIIAFVVFIFSTLIVFTIVTPLRTHLMERLYVRSTSQLLENELSFIASLINLRIEKIRSRSFIFSKHPELINSNNYYDNQQSDQIEKLLLTGDQLWLNNDLQFISKVLDNDLSNDIRKDFIAEGYYLDEYGYNIFSEVFVTNKHGATVASSVKTEDFNQSDEQWWIKAKEDGIYLEGVNYDQNTKTLSITIAVAMNKGGQFLGVTKGTLDIRDVFYSIFDHRLEISSFPSDTVLFTKNMSVIFPQEKISQQTLLDFYLKYPQITNRQYEDDHITAGCIFDENKKCIYNWTNPKNLYGLDLYLLSYHDETVIFSLIRESEVLTLSVTALTVIITLILFIILITYTGRQVFHINNALNNVSKGNIFTRVKIITNDEIGKLAKNINSILEYLTKSKIFEQTILQHIEYSLLIFDTNKNIVFYNKAANDLLNINAPIKKIKNKKYLDIVKIYHRDDGPYSINPIDQLYNDSVDNIELLDLDLMVSTKTKIPVDLVASKIYDDDKNFIGLVVIIRDISEYRRIDKTKSEFVSIASHQLRTPLTAIKWYTEALTKGLGIAVKPEKSQLEYLNVVKESTDRIINLVNALLNVSRLELGTFSVEPEKIYLREIMSSVITQIKPLIQEKNINLTTKCDPKVPAVMMDKNIIQIVFENLVSNAIKYTNKKGKIEIEGQYIEDKKILSKLNDYKGSAGILISVKDNGVGIPKVQQNQIFSKLFRADNVKKIEESGTGLGLYTCKLIMDNIGGSIWFESKENIGSTFYLLLPIEGMKKREGSKKLENIT